MKISSQKAAVTEFTIETLISELIAQRNDDIAAHSQRFFKTGKGEYGQGDTFLGIRVPNVRATIKPYVRQFQGETSLPLLTPLIQHKFHEIRLAGLLLLESKFKQSKAETERAAIYHFYLAHKDCANNWDLVDSSAHIICGGYLLDQPKSILFELAQAENLWHRRIAVITCYAFIKQGQFDTILSLSEQLLSDREDLIHKACGWMLREVGKQDRQTLLAFLDQHYHLMPRTMLRYAIEKLDEALRQSYLKATR